MQTNNGTPLPSDAALSSQDRLDQREVQLTRLNKEDELRADIQEEIKALENDPNATHTMNGKVILRGRARGESIAHGDQKISRAFIEMALSGLSLQAFGDIAKSLTSLVGRFGESADSAKTKPDPNRFEDDHNIYDTEKVTPAVYALLARESDMIAQQELAVETIEDPVQYMRALQEFAELANSLDMRPHPLTGRFVHCIERVREMEERMAMTNTVIESPMHNVFVFRPLNAMGHDSRGIKRLIGDQFDDNPDETIGAVEAKEPPRRILAPHLR